MKINKMMIVTVATTCLVGLSCPQFFNAESIDTKIESQDKKINELSNQKNQSETALADLEHKINVLASESEELLNQKISLEKEISQLSDDIKDLELAIEKRTQKIEDQARSTQINQDEQDLLNVLLDSQSVSDAIGRTVAYTKLVGANNEIMQAQKHDQEELAAKKVSVEKKVEEVITKTDELKIKQTEVEASKAEQVKLAQSILKELEGAKNKKSEFVAQKAEAERIAAEQARKEKEAAAQAKKAEQEAKAMVKQVAEAKKADEKGLEMEGPVSTAKPTGKPGQSDNNKPETAPSTPAPTPTPTPSATGFQNPLAGGYSISSGFGSRQDPTGTAGDFHEGIDMAAPAGTPIMASASGTVVEAGFQGSAGNHVIILHSNGLYSYYMHMSSMAASVGSEVSAGEVIGYVGTTGNSTGNHLHFGISSSLWGGFMDPNGFVSL